MAQEKNRKKYAHCNARYLIFCDLNGAFTNYQCFTIYSNKSYSFFFLNCNPLRGVAIGSQCKAVPLPLISRERDHYLSYRG